ncbi:MAG: hypothetical protein WBW04_09885 [Nitrolancea sp.]
MSQQSSRIQVELHPTAPYSFPLALSYLATSPSSVLEDVDLEQGVCRRALQIDGVDLLLTLRDSGSVEAPQITFGISGECVTPSLTDAAEAHVKRIFLLDVDPEPFFHVANRDPVLGALVDELPGIRPLLVADPYEALIFAIVGQQVNIAFARRMKLALLEQFGRRVRFGEREMLLLPEPERIAGLDPADLLALQFSRQKASYLIELSRLIASGALDLWAIGELPFDDGVAELVRHRGIGRWTAEYVLMRGLGARDSIPAGDLGLRKIIGLAYGLDHTASEAEVREIAQAWAGWRGWAAFLWWLELQTNGFSRYAP